MCGRSSGKTGPPATRASPGKAGGLTADSRRRWKTSGNSILFIASLLRQETNGTNTGTNMGLP